MTSSVWIEEYIHPCAAVSDVEDDQADLVNGDAADQYTDGEEVVKKSKRKKYIYKYFLSISVKTYFYSHV